MALADTISVIYDGTTYACVRIFVLGSKSQYQDPTGVCKLTVSHQYTGNKVSRMIRVDLRKVRVDGTFATQSHWDVSSYNTNDWTTTEAKNLHIALNAAEAASTNLIITKVHGGES